MQVQTMPRLVELYNRLFVATRWCALFVFAYTNDTLYQVHVHVPGFLIKFSKRKNMPLHLAAESLRALGLPNQGTETCNLSILYRPITLLCLWKASLAVVELSMAICLCVRQKTRPASRHEGVTAQPAPVTCSHWWSMN